MTQTIKAPLEKAKADKTALWANEQSKSAEVTQAKYSAEELIELHRSLLRQIGAVYDNPEMKRILGDALRGNWDSVFYDKYKPEILQEK